MMFALFKRRTERRELLEDEKKRRFLDYIEGEYYKIIDDCAKGEKDFTIQNGANKHAAYVLKTIFQHAVREVCMFVQNFDSVFDNNQKLAEAAVKFLQNPESRLLIAYQDPLVKKRRDLLDVQFLRVIFSTSIKGKIEMWDARESASYVNNYFFLNDKGHFRYTVKKGNSVANFGYGGNGIKLAEIFARITAKCEKVLG